MPATPDDLFALLDRLGVAHHTLHHDPAHTVEDAKRLRGPLDGVHTKNLFVRDKKRNIYLITVREDRQVDLPGLSKQLGAKGRFSFCKEDLLLETLGVPPGSVTPFAVMNDADSRVTLVLDAAFRGPRTLYFHPLLNDKTTGLSFDGFSRFLDHCGVAPRFVAFDPQMLVD